MFKAIKAYKQFIRFHFFKYLIAIKKLYASILFSYFQIVSVIKLKYLQNNIKVVTIRKQKIIYILWTSETLIVCDLKYIFFQAF